MESDKQTNKPKSVTVAEKEGAKALYDQPLVLEGKRKRKSTELFSFNEKEKSRKTTDYTGGKGTRFGDIPFIHSNIARTKAENLRFLFKLCYDRVGTRIELKRNLRDFTGFSDEDMIEKKRAALEKLTIAGLKPICDMLGLETNGNKGDIVTRIMDFLEKPFDHGKDPKTRRRSSTGSRPRKKSKVSESDEDNDEELEDDAIEQDKNSEGEENAMDTSEGDEDKEGKTASDTTTKEGNEVNTDKGNPTTTSKETKKETEVESESKEEQEEPAKED